MSKNPHTGDEQKTKPSTNKYREGWENIFGKKCKNCQEQTKELQRDFTCRMCYEKSLEK